MAEHLTKNEELELGLLVQKSLAASEAYKKDTKAPVYVVKGEQLTPSQIKRVIRAGETAKKQLAESYEAFVWSRARNFKSRYPSAPDLEDLAQEGFVGLVKAIQKYDPERGNKLSTVAFYWIDQAIGRSTNKTGRAIRLPENRIGDFVKINRMRTDLEDSGLTPGEIDEAIMEELKLSRADFINITTAGVSPISLNRKISYDGSEARELMDFVADEETTPSSESTAIADMMKELLGEKLATLSEMEKDIVAASFLLGTNQEKRATIHEIREKYEISQPKLKRILKNALNKLRADFDSMNMNFDDFIS